MPTGCGEHLDRGGDGAAEELLAAVREVVADLRPGHAVPVVGLDSHLDADLGLDSLSVAELLVRTEELFGISLPDATLVTARTPRDLLMAAAAVTDRVHPRRLAEHGVEDLTDGVRRHGVAQVTAGLRGQRAPTGGSWSRQSGSAQLSRMGAGSFLAAARGAGPWVAAGLYGVWTLASFGVLVAAAGPLIALAPTLRLRWRLVRGAGRLLTVLAGVRVHVEGERHLPRDRPFVIVANHASHVDPLVLTLILEEPAVFVAVADLADNPLVRLGLRRMHAHLVERGDRARGVADAEALTETVRDGRTVVFFPEGRRSPASGLEPFQTGAFLVAARAGAPVVPIALQGTRTVLPVGRLLPRRTTVTVTVGPPVTTSEVGWQGAMELQREARRLILRHCDEPDLA